MQINREAYRSSVLGCWLGKNIGGTLGAPFEWRRQINDVSFYTQDLQGEPLPNDDLDIQLLWLVALEEKGVDIDSHVLGEYWLLYVTPHWSEYGNAKINLRSGLLPPWSGNVNNPHKHSCGAFIRSEIWACIAPGCPQIAARYAYQDAIIDHGDGEGTFAEVFCAALQSAAFVEKDIRKLLDIGLSYIPEQCGIAGAVRNAIVSYDNGHSWREARDAMLEAYRGGTMFNMLWCTSEEDQKKGFHEGTLGWDAPSNIGIMVLGLLYGEGDFAKTLCTTVNCGEDTDCTAATVGALFGILHGADAIPEKWVEPIGRSIKTACLNLGELGYFGNQLPGDVDNLTDRTERMAQQVLARNGMSAALTADSPTDTSGAALYAGPLREILFRDRTATVFRFPFFEVAVDYGDSVAVRDGVPKTVRVSITNTYKVQAALKVHWHLREGWTIAPSADGMMHVSFPPLETRHTASFTLACERITETTVRHAIEITMDGRPSAMVVPVTLLNGNFD